MSGTSASSPLCCQELQSHGERRSFTTPAGMEFTSKQKESNETAYCISCRWNAAFNPNATGQQTSEFKYVRITIFKN